MAPVIHPLKLIFPIALFLMVLQTGSAEDIIAVLSSDSGHYREALEGFQETLKQPIRVVNLQNEKPKLSGQQKLIIAFGGKAAMESYIPGLSVITCMAPGIEVKQGTYANIEMAPRSSLLLSNLKELQPFLKQLAVFWSSDSMDNYIQELRRSASLIGIETTLIKIEDAASLPNRLREVQGNVDALLLPPDPSLVNQKNFTTFKDFAWDNHVPFYVPTEGLVEMGGTASVASSFREIGHTAAKVALATLNGTSTEGTVYTDKVEMTINLGVAKNGNLKISPDLLLKMDRVFQ